MPCVTTVKEKKGFNILENQINEAIKTKLRTIPWVNVSLDLWSDTTHLSNEKTRFITLLGYNLLKPYLGHT